MFRCLGVGLYESATVSPSKLVKPSSRTALESASDSLARCAGHASGNRQSYSRHQPVTARGAQTGRMLISGFKSNQKLENRYLRMLNRSILSLIALLMVAGTVFAQERSTGGLKGKVRVEVGTPAGVAIVVRQGEREVARGVTDRKGDFLVSRLTPGLYGVTFRKPGLSIGTIENVEVRAGKTKSLGDRLVLGLDEGSIAFIRGAVFDQDGRSFPGVKIELFQILDDGTLKKLEGRVSNEIGAFVFRLVPELAKYRVIAKASGSEPVSKDVEVDGAAVYRVALSVTRTAKG